MMPDTNCRLCFEKLDKNYSNIFDCQNEELSLGAKIMICLSIPVHNNDNLPEKICIPCTDEITRFYDFRNKCQSTYYSLIQKYKENGIKEPVDSKVNLSLTKDEEILDEYIINSLEEEPEINDDKIKSDNLENFVEESFVTSREIIKTGEEKNLSKKYKCFYCDLLFDSYQGAVDHCIGCMVSKKNTNGIDALKEDQDDKETGSDYAEVEFIEDIDYDGEEKNYYEAEAEENVAEMIENKKELEDNSENKFEDEDYISSDEPYQDESENQDPKDSSQNILLPKAELNPEVRAKRRYCKKKIYPENYPCPECKKPFSSRSLMRRHFMVHTGERPYRCETCGRRFSQLGALNFHKKLHEDPPYRCDRCSKPFMRPSDLEKHLRTHTGEKPFTCQVCGKNFTQLVAVQQHERVHTGDKPFRCRICGKTFSQSANKSKHEKIHQKGLKPFICDLCGRSFSDNEEMEEHKAGHGGEKVRECDFCGMKFKKFSEVIDHVRRYHTFERPHTCDFCQKAFYSLYSLKQHIMTHTGQKPFACAECPSKFTQKGNLQKHFSRKHPGKIFKDIWNNKDTDLNGLNGLEGFEDNSIDKPDVDVKIEN
ncbi:zinc finger protein 260-like [Cotesia glomerata]|nr:zinc finger protein 260-like [Cotesia glomerata]